MTSGQEETTKLRKEVKECTLNNESASKDLFVQLFARLDEKKRELIQRRAESRTYASAAGGDRTPRGEKWEGREEQDNGGTPMDSAGEEKGNF